MPGQAPLDGLLKTSSRLFARSGTPVAVGEPHSVSTDATRSGAVGSLTSKTCRPSHPPGNTPGRTGSPSQVAPAGAGEVHERTRILPQTITSPRVPAPSRESITPP